MFFGRENPPAASRYPPLTRGGFGGRGKSLSPLSRCARQLPLIRGVGPKEEGFRAADSRPYSPQEASRGA